MYLVVSLYICQALFTNTLNISKNTGRHHFFIRMDIRYVVSSTCNYNSNFCTRHLYSSHDTRVEVFVVLDNDKITNLHTEAAACRDRIVRDVIRWNAWIIPGSFSDNTDNAGELGHELFSLLLLSSVCIFIVVDLSRKNQAVEWALQYQYLHSSPEYHHYHYQC